MVGPPSQVEPFSNGDSLPPATPEPSPPRFKLKPHKPKSSRSYEKKEIRSHSSKEISQKPRRHNSEASLSTIAEETHSQESTSSMSSLDQQPEPSSVQSSLNGGTSVFLEPHITVETTTVPANVSISSSRKLLFRFRNNGISCFPLTECKQRLLPMFFTFRPGDEGDGHSAVQDGGAHAPRVDVRHEAVVEEVEEKQLRISRRGQFDPFLLERRSPPSFRRP